MKVWPIDPLVPRNLRLEVPEKLPQGLTGAFLLVKQIKVASNHMEEIQPSRITERSNSSELCTVNLFYVDAVPGLDSCRGLVRLTLISAWVQLRGALRNSRRSLVGQHTWMRGTLVRFLVPSIQITPVCGVYAG